MWPFRRKSADGSVSLSTERALGSPSSQDVGRQHQQQQQQLQQGRRAQSLSVESTQHGLASSEITAQVYYLGALEVSDSKSIPTMVETIRELKSRAKSGAPGKHCRLVEFRLKRDQLTLYEMARQPGSGQDLMPEHSERRGSGSTNKKKKRTSGSSQSSSQARHGEMLDDSMGGQAHRGGGARHGGERVPIFRVHASSIAMCLQESLYGGKKDSHGTDHFALNMTELVQLRMTGGQVVTRRIHWCHVFQAKSHTEVGFLLK